MDATPNQALAVSVADAAQMIGISRAFMYKMVMDGDIESFTVGRRRLVPVASLRAWVERQASTGLTASLD